MIILLMFLFLVAGLIPFVGIIITDKLNYEQWTNYNVNFLGGFITGIIESLLLFSFMLIAFIGFKNSTGGVKCLKYLIFMLNGVGNAEK